MHHYCVIVAKSAEAEGQLTARLERFIEDRLSFEPDELALHRLGRRTVAFSVSVAQGPVGIETPVHIAEEEACLVGGLPTFERFPQFEPSTRMRPAAWTNDLMKEHDPSDLYVSLGGSYSAVRATSEEVIGFASFAGFDSLFYLDNDSYSVLGSRPALVAAFQSGGAYSSISLLTLSWILSSTMIIGEETPWQEVRRLRTDEVLRISDEDLTVTPVRVAAYTPPDPGEIPALYDSAVHGLVSRFEWYLKTGLSLSAHLTGGKDSRTILALLFATGSIDRVGSILTVGSEENGDVIVARQIAAAMGLKNHVVQTGAKRAVQEVDLEKQKRRFRFSPWKYDMYLTPYDGWRVPAGAPPREAIFMGGGGGIIRQKGIAPDGRVDSLEAITDTFTNWYYEHDALELLDPEVSAWQRDVIRNKVKGMVSAGVVNLQQRFYIEQRMANWGNAHFRNNGASSVAPLLDFNLARLMHTRTDMDDEVPYEILTRCAPELRGFPFHNAVWQGQTGERAKRDGTFRPPLEAEVARSFPWQFALYREHRDELLHECLRSISVWEGIVPPANVHRLIARPVEPFNSSHVKRLFGLVAGTNYLLGRLAPDRDFASSSDPLRLVGNQKATASRWFAYRRETADVAA